MMLHKALRLLRTYHQFTQIELAKRLDISNSYLSEIESGDKPLGVELLQKYAEVFKIPASAILLFSENLGVDKKLSSKIRVAAAGKIVRILEWIEERNAVTKT